MLPELLSTARRLANGWSRSRVLAAVAARFAGDQRAELSDEVLRSARSVKDFQIRIWALAELAGLRSFGGREQALSAAVSCLCELRTARDYIDYLRRTKGLFSGDHLGTTFAFLRRNPPGIERAEALTLWAPRLPDELVAAAVDLARPIREEMFRSLALVALKPRLVGDNSSALIRAYTVALQEVREMAWEGVRADAIEALASRLPEPLLPEALEIACSLEGDDLACADAIVALAPRLTGDALSRAFSCACRLDSVDDVLVAIAPRLPVERLSDALGVALSIPSRAVTGDFSSARRLRAGATTRGTGQG